MKEEILNAALEYAAQGWPVFPISKTKAPLTAHGFKDASTDPEQIRRWWAQTPAANVAIATGAVSGLIVIDIDIDHEAGKYGDDVFREWVNDNGVYIDTKTAVTGRGGKHLYFRTTKSYGCKVNALPGVDIRGEGGYVVAPPSIHKNGNPYFWDGDDDEEITCVQEDSDVEFFFETMFAKQEKSETFEMPDTLAQGSRNDTLFKAASSLQAKGLSDSAILAAVQEENRARCNPPLSDREVETIVKSALRYKKGTPEPAEVPAQPAKPKTFQKLRKATDLLKEDLPDLRVLVGVGDELPFLVEGTCILSAKSKLGKSWLAMELCNAVSKGEDFLGYKTEKCDTLYLDLETVKNLKQKRLKTIIENTGSLGDGFNIQDDAMLLGEGFEEELEHYLQEDPKIGVVVVDVFQRILRPKRRDVSDYEYYYEQIGKLNEITKKHHISIILVCHDRKSVDEADPFANILGSTALQGATDQMIVMFKRRVSDPVTHIMVKGRTIDGLISLTAAQDKGWHRAENAEALRMNEEYKNSPVTQAVRLLVERDGFWEGRCNQFVTAVKGTIDLGLTKPDGSDDLKTLGGILSNRSFQDYLLGEGIKTSVKKNGSGARMYKFTVGTVDTVDEPLTGWEREECSPFENDVNTR